MKDFPYLALDSAGEKTILCDYPIKMFSNTTQKETSVMTRIMSDREVQLHAKKLISRLLAKDAALDDETTEKLKGFLKSRLSAEDHEQVCNMLTGDVEAEDTEPPAVDPGAKPTGQLAKAGDKLPRTAADAKAVADFHARFPGLAAVKIDNSGLQPRRRSASYSDVAAKSFSERFPSLAHIKLA